MEENRNHMANEAPAPLGAEPREDTAFLPSQYDTAVMETWLEDRAKAGWQLRRFNGWDSGVFEQSEPRPTRYRLTPLTRKEKRPDGERLELCAAQGWEYVTTRLWTFHVWRTDDPTAPEMDTDPVTQAEGYRWVRKRMIRQFLWTLALVLALAAVTLYTSLQPNGSPLLYGAENAAPFEEPLRWGAIATCLILSALQLRGMDRTLRRLRAGVPMDRPVPYKRRQRVTALLSVLAVVWYVYVVLVSGFVDGFRRIDSDEAALSQARYVDIAVLDPSVEVTDIWRAESKSLEWATDMYRVEQFTTGNGTTGTVTGSAYTEYYRLATVGLAEELERELVERYGTRTTGIPEFQVPMEAAPTEDLDGFWIKDWPDENAQGAVARLGKTVLYVEYRGAADLRAHTDYLAELLR